MLSKNFFYLLICAALLSCHPDQPLSETQKQHITKEIRATFDNYYKDIREKGLTAEFNYLDNTADFFWLPPGYSFAIPFDSVKAVITKNAPRFRKVDNQIDNILIVPLNEQYAQFSARVHATVTDNSGTMQFDFLETGVLVKRKDGWKFLSGQTSMLNRQ